MLENQLPGSIIHLRYFRLHFLQLHQRAAAKTAVAHPIFRRGILYQGKPLPAVG